MPSLGRESKPSCNRIKGFGDFTAETQSTLRKSLFAQSGDCDWAKTYSSNLSNVFVCRRLPTNKKLILCVLCASAVIFLKKYLRPSAFICG